MAASSRHKPLSKSPLVAVAVDQIANGEQNNGKN